MRLEFSSLTAGWKKPGRTQACARLFFVFYPANKASKLSAIDALHYE